MQAVLSDQKVVIDSFLKEIRWSFGNVDIRRAQQSGPGEKEIIYMIFGEDIVVPGIPECFLRDVVCEVFVKNDQKQEKVICNITEGILYISGKSKSIKGKIDDDWLSVYLIDDSDKEVSSLDALNQEFSIYNGYMPIYTNIINLSLKQIGLGFDYTTEDVALIEYESEDSLSLSITNKIKIEQVKVGTEVVYEIWDEWDQDSWLPVLHYKIVGTLAIGRVSYLVNMIFYSKSVFGMEINSIENNDSTKVLALHEIIKTIAGDDLYKIANHFFEVMGIKNIELKKGYIEFDVMNTSSMRQAECEIELIFWDKKFSGAISILPNFNLSCALVQEEKNAIFLNKIIEEYWGIQNNLPDVAVTNFELFIYPSDERYSINFTIESNWSLTIPFLPPLTIKYFSCAIYKTSDSLSGWACGAVNMGDIQIVIATGINKKFLLQGSINEIDLTKLLKQVCGEGVSLPPELPEIKFNNIDIMIIPSEGVFSFSGNTDFIWHIEGEQLKCTASIKISNEGVDNSNKLPFTCNLDIKAAGPLTIIENGLIFNQFNLSFNLDSNKNWFLSGGIESKLLNQIIKLQASYEKDYSSGSRRLKLFHAFGEKDKELLNIGNIVKLEASQCDIYIEQKTNSSGELSTGFSIKVGSDLSVANGAFRIGGNLSFDYTEKQKTLSIHLKEMSVDIVPEIKENDRILSNRIAFKLSGALLLQNEGENWSFKSRAYIAVEGLPKYLTELEAGDERGGIKLKLIPEKIAIETVIDRQGLILQANLSDQNIDVVLPDIRIDENNAIRLSDFGKTRLGISKVSITLGNKCSMDTELQIGLPSKLNHILFGTKSGSNDPALNIFKVFNLENDDSLLKLSFGLSEDSIYFRPTSSPFYGVDVNEDHIKADLKEFGQFEIKIPRFELGVDGFKAKNIGFKAKDLQIPLTPIKELLRRSGVENIDLIVPDGLPVEVKLFNADGVPNKEEIFRVLKPVLLLSTKSGVIPKEAQDQILSAVDKGIDEIARCSTDKLPLTLKEYFNFKLPEEFAMDIAITPDGGANVNIKVDPMQPIKLLFPGMLGLIPVIQGVRLRSFSFGTILAGQLFTMNIDAEFDQFDLIGLAASLVIPENEYLPKINNVHRRLVIKNLYSLIIYQTGIPIPVPIFYEDLGFEYLGIEGFEAKSHIKFPMPQLSVKSLSNTLSPLIKFVKEKDYRLEEDNKGQEMINISFIVDDLYLRLPKYLGGELIGHDSNKSLKPLFAVDALSIFAKILNSFKFLNFDEILGLVPLEYRINNTKIQLGPLSIQSQYCITNTQEFIEVAYKKLDIEENQKSIYTSLLLSKADTTKVSENFNMVVLDQNIQELKVQKEGGLVIFLRGSSKIENTMNIDAAFALIADVDEGFVTTVKIDGRIQNIIDLKLQGSIYVKTEESVEVLIRGNNYLEFANLQIFESKGFIVVTEDTFIIEGEFALLKDSGKLISLYGNVSGVIDNKGIYFTGDINCKLGAIILADAKITIVAHSESKEKYNKNNGIWINANFLGSKVVFAIENTRTTLDTGKTLGNTANMNIVSYEQECLESKFECKLSNIARLEIKTIIGLEQKYIGTNLKGTLGGLGAIEIKFLSTGTITAFELCLFKLVQICGTSIVSEDKIVFDGELLMPQNLPFSFNSKLKGYFGKGGIISFNGDSNFKIGINIGSIWCGIETIGKLTINSTNVIASLEGSATVGAISLPKVSIILSVTQHKGRPCIMAAWRLPPLVSVYNHVGDIHQLIIYLDQPGSIEFYPYYYNWNADWPDSLKIGDIVIGESIDYDQFIKEKYRHYKYNITTTQRVIEQESVFGTSYLQFFLLPNSEILKIFNGFPKVVQESLFAIVQSLNCKDLDEDSNSSLPNICIFYDRFSYFGQNNVNAFSTNCEPICNDLIASLLTKNSGIKSKFIIKDIFFRDLKYILFTSNNLNQTILQLEWYGPNEFAVEETFDVYNPKRAFTRIVDQWYARFSTLLDPSV